MYRRRTARIDRQHRGGRPRKSDHDAQAVSPTVYALWVPKSDSPCYLVNDGKAQSNDQGQATIARTRWWRSRRARRTSLHAITWPSCRPGWLHAITWLNVGLVLGHHEGSTAGGQTSAAVSRLCGQSGQMAPRVAGPRGGRQHLRSQVATGIYIDRGVDIQEVCACGAR